MTKKIVMHVNADGSTKIEAEGYEGGSCLDATAPFEALFSNAVTRRVMVGDCGPASDMGERVR